LADRLDLYEARQRRRVLVDQDLASAVEWHHGSLAV
jgi:hypothetical protein